MESGKHVFMTCPGCGEYVCVQGRAYQIDRAFVPVVTDCDDSRPVCLAWNEIDMEADFVYECPECGQPLCGDLDELGSMIKDGRACIE